MDSLANGVNSINGVKDSFSSWDKCMSKAYCKWPVIIGIIIGSLIVISIVWCCARCLCCGVSCCCGCFSCFNACCPGPRGGGRQEKGGYQQAPPIPYQYQPPPPMNPSGANNSYYGGGGGAAPAAAARNVPQTATFDASRPKPAKVNEDALPAMPSWDSAQKRYVEEPHEETEVEMDKLNSQQETGLLTGSAKSSPQDRYYNNNSKEEAGDLGAGGMQAQHAHATPYQDHNYAASSPYQPRSPAGPYAAQGYQQTTGPYSPTGSQSHHNMYSSTSVVSPVARQYSNAASYYPGDDRQAQYQQPQQQQYNQQQQYSQHQEQRPVPQYNQSSQYGQQQQYDHQRPQQPYLRGYEPSIAAPSYHTHDVASPMREDAMPQAPQQYQPYGGVSGKPVVPVVPYGQQPNWRDI